MKKLIFILLMCAPLFALSQGSDVFNMPKDSTVQDTSGLEEVTILANKKAGFPFRTVIWDRKVVVLTIEQLRVLSKSAAKSSVTDSLVTQLFIADDLNREILKQMGAKVELLEESKDAAIQMYQAEKLKRLNNETALRAKDEIIELQTKEIRRQRITKWVGYGVALVVVIVVIV